MGLLALVGCVYSFETNAYDRYHIASLLKRNFMFLQTQQDELDLHKVTWWNQEPHTQWTNWLAWR